MSILLAAGITLCLKPAKADVLENECLTVCIPADVESFDPTNYRSRITQIVLKNIFDSLTARGPDNVVIPHLAQSWRLVNDTYWQFKLRPGVRFHDGRLLSAADVKATLDRVIGQKPFDNLASPRKSLLAPISLVIAEDNLTVGIETRYPWPNLPLMLSLQEIAPTHPAQPGSQPESVPHPVGTGPFMFIEATPGKEISLQRFEGYFRGAPANGNTQWMPAQRLVFAVVPSDLDRVAMLKSGRCDIIFNLPPKSLPILESLIDLRVVKAPATRSWFAEINCTRPPLDDRRIRQALNQAVDIEALIRHELRGHGIRLATILLPNTFGFDPDLLPYPHDLPAASQMLSSSAHAIDRPLKIFANQDDLAFAGTIALGLTRMGLRSHVVTAPTFRPRKTGPGAPWDIFVGSWGNTSLDPAGILVPKLKTDGYGNFSGFSSPELDRLMTTAQSTMDPTARIDLYRRIQSLIYYEAPMIFGYARNEYFGVAARVKHFTASTTGLPTFYDVFLEERP